MIGCDTLKFIRLDVIDVKIKKQDKDYRNDIYIKSKYINIPNLDVYLSIVYMAKRYLNEAIVCFTLPQIEYTLTGTYKMTQKRKKVIKDAVDYLIDNDIIEVLDNYNDHYTVANNFRVNDGTNEPFVIISYDELKAVYALTSGRTSKIINYFVKLIQTINSHSKVGWTAIETLADTLEVSTKTICQWNTILEQHDLIYIHRYDVCKVVGNHSQNLSNIYGRPCDKAVIDAYAQSKLAELDRVNLSKKLSADARRKISKQYNDFIKGCYKGNVQELYDSCVTYNNALKADDTKRKDLSVFDGLVSNDTAVSANEADDIANDSASANTVATDTANDSDSIDSAVSDSANTASANTASVITFKEGVFGVEDATTVATDSASANVDDTTIEDYIFQRQIQQEIFELNAIVMRNSSWM